MIEKKWWVAVWIITFLALLLNTTSVYKYEVKTLQNKTTTLEPYRGKVMLIVNTASCCGYTQQLEGLEKLYRMYRPRGFSVLGFPTNHVPLQEPLQGEQIKRFCKEKYGVTFPIFGKIDLNKESLHPLYRYLQTAVGDMSDYRSIEWNFTKFLIDRNGHVIRRYAPSVTPEEITADIERLL